MIIPSHIRTTRGFTLIELLVVIAIIGLLASVILASLGTARSSGSDASIKAEMQQIKNGAELFYAKNKNYYGSDTDGLSEDDTVNCSTAVTGNVFNPTDGVGDISLSVARRVSGNTSGSRVFCAVGAGSKDSWAFAAPLFNPTGTNTGWCVDSTGRSKEVSISFGTAGAPLGGRTVKAACP